MTAIQQALLKAGVVDKDAVDWATGRDGKPPNVQAPALAEARRRWLVDAKGELIADPTSETMRRLIREAHDRYDDGSDEFRQFLRPLYELRDRLDRLDRSVRRRVISAL